ncbi:hypothetical protein [Nocardioides panacisoli]
MVANFGIVDVAAYATERDIAGFLDANNAGVSATPATPTAG